MKKSLIITGMFAMISLFMQQDLIAQEKRTFDKEKKHTQFDRTKGLDLTETQKKQIQVIQENYVAQVKKIENKKLTAADRNAQLEKARNEKKEKIKAILTTEQIQKMERNKERRMEKMKHDRSEGKYPAHHKGRKPAKAMDPKIKAEMEAIRNNPNLTEEQKKTQLQELRAKYKAEFERKKQSQDRKIQ